MRRMKKWMIALMVLIPALAYAGGQKDSALEGMETEGLSGDKAKYVFVFVGDGVGMPQVNAAEAYLRTLEGGIGVEKLNFAQFPAQGLTTTYAEDRYITGSAAAATAMATGKKTSIGVISMDSTKTEVYQTIAEQAKEAGMKVGIVSSVDLDHATPAAFYAHQPSRNNYYEIGLEAADSGVDYFGGGRFRLSKTPEGKPDQHEIFRQKGWTIVDNKAAFQALSRGTEKVYAYNYGFDSDALPYEIDREEEGISLAQFTAKGIELLDNDKGFFMMIEGGKIDWACHANDGVSAIHDTLAFADAVQEAVDFYHEHPEETLIVVTGDHECGGLTLGFAGTGYETSFELLGDQKKSADYFNAYVLKPYLAEGGESLQGLLPQIEEIFGMGDFNEYETGLLEQAMARTLAGDEQDGGPEEKLLYGGYIPLTMTLTHIQNNRSGLAWTSYKHTGVPVPTFAIGAGAARFHGYYDNTDVYHKTAAAMGLLAQAVASR